MAKKDDKSKESAEPKPTAFQSLRETIDSIVVAFILAFLFRTFEAEAFVIPTGSMALTLMGAHKEVKCEKCGYPYRVSASHEAPEEADGRPAIVVSSICPNCRYHTRYGDLSSEQRPDTFAGDRILVTKYSYEFGDPERFDVAVFKNPGQAKQNYIKRVVGLPNEELMIYRGDLYSRPSSQTDAPFRIARKPPDKVTAVLQTVYDNDYVLAQIIERGWPRRWISTTPVGAPGWQTPYDQRVAKGDNAAPKNDELKTFSVAAKPAEDAWLRYQHIVPFDEVWEILDDRSLTAAEVIDLAKPQLITDFCEYNTDGVKTTIQDETRRFEDRRTLPPGPSSRGMHWVGDLALECELKFTDPNPAPDAEAVLELIEGGVAFQCRINAATGDITLGSPQFPNFGAKKSQALDPKESHTIRFAAVDDQLLLWVDDDPIDFGPGVRYLATDRIDPPTASFDTAKPGLVFDEAPLKLDGESSLPAFDIALPKTGDLQSPAGIAARRTTLEIAHLKILRDVYYIADFDGSNHSQFHDNPIRSPMTDYMAKVFDDFARPGHEFAPHLDNSYKLRNFMSNITDHRERFEQLAAVRFRLHADQFFAMGDNSPSSSDSRLWKREQFVKRELLIGKALFVYWPHAVNIPGTSINWFPNFGQMRRIR